MLCWCFLSFVAVCRTKAVVKGEPHFFFLCVVVFVSAEGAVVLL